MDADSSRAHALGGLRRVLIHGAAYEMVGYGASQLIRFGSNLILSRLLFPEAFGLVALVQIMNQGLVMLSDVGLPTAIVQSERGDDPRFLNTAFTWQVLRGTLLWLVTVVLAVPMAMFYDEPELRLLIPIGGLSVLIGSFRSTGYFTLRRRLTLAPLMLIELASQTCAVLVMIVWARVSPSVWTLLGGMLTSSAVVVIGSHLLRVGYRNRFAWDRDSARAMFSFGKWIAGSSFLTFASGQGDRMILGHYLGSATLGVYSIAFFLSNALGEAITRITHGVFFPAYSRVRDEGVARLREVYYGTRVAVDGIVLPVLGALAVLGPFLVDLLYDERYSQAGWMLQVLAVRVALGCLVWPCQFCLFAIGQTRYGFYLNLARVLSMAIGIPLGFRIAGIAGLVWAVALSELPAVAVVYLAFARHGLLRIERELRAPAGYVAGMALGATSLLVLRHFDLA